MDAWQITGLVVMVSGVVALVSAGLGYYAAEKEHERRGR